MPIPRAACWPVGTTNSSGSIAVSSGAFLQVGATTNAATTVFGFSNTNTTIAGGIIGPNPNSHLGKVGTGTLTYTGVGPYVGNLSIRDGTFDVRGLAGRRKRWFLERDVDRDLLDLCGRHTLRDDYRRYRGVGAARKSHPHRHERRHVDI